MKIYNPTGFSTNLTGSFSGSVKGTLTATGNIIPDVSGAYDIGSTEFPFKDLYITQNSLKFIDDSTGNEIGRISVNSNTGDIKLLNTKNLTEEQKATLTAENVGAEALSPVSASSLWVSQSISPGHTNTSIGHTTAPFHTIHTQFISASSTNITGDLKVGGTVTAQEFHTEFVSASIIYQSGSTQFGNSADDTHTFSGNLEIYKGDGYDTGTGSFNITHAESTRYKGFIRLQTPAGEPILSLGTYNDPTTYDTLFLRKGFVGIGTDNPSTVLLSIRGYGGIDSNANQGLTLTSNHYYDSGDKYRGNGYGSIISQDTGGTYAGHIRFQQAGLNSSGAGAAMTLSDSMVIDSSGNLQIGITTLSASGDPRVTVGSKGYYYPGSGNGLGDLHIGNGTYGLSIGTAIGGGGAGDTRIWTTGGTNRLFIGVGDNITIESGGNVGIGITSPGAKLDVDGSVKIGNLKIQNIDGGRIGFNRNTADGTIYNSNYAAFQINGAYSGADYLDFQNYDSSGSYVGGFVLKNGGLGIGTTSPGALLNLYNASNAYIRSERSDGTNQYVDVGTNSAGQHFVYGYGDYPMLFGTNGSTKMVILSGGNVGIGTTSPSQKLHIEDAEPLVRINSTSSTANKGIQFTYNNTLYSRITHNASSGELLITSGESGQSGYYMNFNVNGNNAMRIHTNSNVGIGTITNSTTGGFTDTTVLIKQKANGPTGGGLHIEQSDVDNVAFFGFSGSAFRIGTSYRTGGAYMPIELTTQGSTRIHIANNGYIGIGTTSPAQKLHVVGNAWINRPSNKVDNASCTEFGSRVEFNNDFVSGQSGYVAFRYPTYDNFLISGDYDGNIGGAIPNIQFGRQSSVYMHIKSSDGNVGIGTTTPSATLDVNGSVRHRGAIFSEHTISLSGNFTAGTYYDLFTVALGIPEGIYIIHAYLDTYAVGGGVYYMHFTSVPFYWVNTGSNNPGFCDFPPLIGTGHALNGDQSTLPKFRLQQAYSGAGTIMQFDPGRTWSGIDGTGGKSVNFYFKKLGA